MKIPRDIAGDELARALCRQFNYERINQTGSHIILQAETPSHHRVAIPAHATLRVGTFNAILRAIAENQGIDKNDVLKRLFDKAL